MTASALSHNKLNQICISRVEIGLFHTRLIYLLFLPLPIIDSLNGMINGGANEGFFSIGMAYRLCVIAYCCLVLVRGVIPKRFLAIAVSILILVVLPHAFDLLDGSFLSLTIKTLLPLLCIEAFIKEAEYESQTHDSLEWLIRCWSILFPLAILIPFAFGLGFQTYDGENVGYKGYFFAQNDLCFVLSVLFFFCCGKVFRESSLRDCLKLCLIGICIIILGMKSGYILMIVSIAYWVIQSEIEIIKRLGVVLILCAVALAVFPFVSDAVNSILSRWMYFSNTMSSFVDFLSSGRLERITIAIDYLFAMENNPIWFLFGVGLRYSKCLEPYGLIEMDPFDLFFQFGIMGSAYLMVFYFRFLLMRLPKRYRCYRFVLFMSILLSVAAGHVLNSALSAMVFSVLCGLVWSVRYGGIKEER